MTRVVENVQNLLTYNTKCLQGMCLEQFEAHFQYTGTYKSD